MKRNFLNIDIFSYSVRINLTKVINILIFLLSVSTIIGCKSDFAWYTISPLTEQGQSNLNFLIDGYQDTILLSLTAITISLFFGLFLALMGFSKNRLISGFNRVYIAVFRSIPVMALVLWVFYGLPMFLGINLESFFSGVIALALSDISFEAEIFRAGIQSVGKGQREAALSIGLKKNYIYRFIIIPQALRKILPALGNQFIYMLKMSAIVSVIGLTELTKKANELVVTTYRPLEIYTILIIEYFVLIVILSWLFHRLEKRLNAAESKSQF